LGVPLVVLVEVLLHPAATINAIITTAAATFFILYSPSGTDQK
jgi:hypothetical protein